MNLINLVRINFALGNYYLCSAEDSQGYRDYCVCSADPKKVKVQDVAFIYHGCQTMKNVAHLPATIKQVRVEEVTEAIRHSLLIIFAKETIQGIRKAVKQLKKEES